MQGRNNVSKQKDQDIKALKCKLCLLTHNFGCKNCLNWGRKCNVCNDQNCFVEGIASIEKTQKVRYDQEVGGVNKGVEAIFLSKVESGK